MFQYTALARDKAWQPGPYAGVPVLRGDPAVVSDALSGRGSLDDALDGHPAIVHRLGSLARFFTTPP